MSEIEKQKVWEEHLRKVAHFQRLHHVEPAFRINPYTASKHMLPQPINPREARFLDREKAALSTFTKRLGGSAGATVVSDRPAAAALSASITLQKTNDGAGQTTIKTVAAPASLPPIVLVKDPLVVSPRGAEANATNHGAEFSVVDRVTEVSRRPTEKYSFPQTEAQELGWYSRPLVPTDPRFRHGLKSCDVTQFVGMK